MFSRWNAMKAFAMFVLIVLAMASFAEAQFYKEALKWDGDTSEMCITTQHDTTDAFLLPMDYNVRSNYGKDYPAQLAFQFNTVEQNDSTHITWKYQLSLDGSKWLTAVAIDTMTAEDEISVKTLSSWSSALYGRLIATAKLASGDTVYVSGTFCKIY